jgi:hypothetical protein
MNLCKNIEIGYTLSPWAWVGFGFRMHIKDRSEFSVLSIISCWHEQLLQVFCLEKELHGDP